MLTDVTGKTLRPYQSVLMGRVVTNICANIATLAVLPTGGGKTAVFSKVQAEFDGPSISLAHRRELIAQMSRGLASEGCEHQIIAPPSTIRMIAAANANSFGHSFVSPGARAAVASVDSLKDIDPRWAARKRLVIVDEGHHALPDNKWGRAVSRFSKAAISGWTATPERADGMGLDGVYTELVLGPTMRELIDQAHLCDYRIICANSAGLDLAKVDVSKKTGDYSPKQLRATMQSAQITGDVVGHYKRFAAGKLGLTFTVDVAAAEEMAAAYREAGVPAAALSAKTKPTERADMIRRFARRELLQLVNVDLFGEGFDLSASAGMDVCVEVVSMARPTHSWGLFAQQFGRALRLGPGKERAIIIDHVGNTVRHDGPPDFPRPISLAGRERRSRGPDDQLKMRVCDECTGPYLRELGSCPYCGHVWVPAERSTPAAVDGLLSELDPAVLAQLRAKTERMLWGDAKTEAYYSATGIGGIAVMANVKRQRANRSAQLELRGRIAELFGTWRAAGASDDTIYRRFFIAYGIDTATACGLRAKDALGLLERLCTT